MSTISNNNILFSLLEKHNLSLDEKDDILNIIMSIYSHDEFQRRMTSEFCHHDTVTLGEHILEVTIITYILHKKFKINEQLDLALKIAMMHDLYTKSWQNKPDGPPDRFLNWHGFRHPIETVINSIVWYPEMFNAEEDSKKIIDGIVHHMFPFPVHRFIDSDDNILQLRNFDYVKQIGDINKQILINSSNKVCFGDVSICPSSYNEGKIACVADKIVSISNLRTSDIDGITALVTGKNKSLEKKQERKNFIR